MNEKRKEKCDDEQGAGITQRERDWRDWKMIAGIDRTGDFIAFDPDDIMRDD